MPGKYRLYCVIYELWGLSCSVAGNSLRRTSALGADGGAFASSLKS